jgi:hypothetical protein
MSLKLEKLEAHPDEKQKQTRSANSFLEGVPRVKLSQFHTHGYIRTRILCSASRVMMTAEDPVRLYT